MTLHAAKVLEFPVVFLLAIEDGILPHERSATDESQLEEERRLAFVGVTRAQSELHLSHALRRDYRGQRRIAIPSGFLLELPRDEMDCAHARPGDDWDLEGWDDASQAPDDELDASFDPSAFDDEPTPAKRGPAASVTTAAAMLAGGRGDAPVGPSVPPDAFRVGMAVVHPELGPGKVVTLSGAGKGRRATVRFPAAGERRFVLAYSPLRPAGP